MIPDIKLTFMDRAALSTSATGLALLGNQPDLGLGGKVGTGTPVYVVIVVNEQVTSGGAATVSFELVSDAQAAIAVDGTATRHYKSAAFPVASLVPGYTIAIPLPGGKPIYERFIGLLQDVGGFVLTGGKISAFFAFDPQDWHAYDSLSNP